MVRISEGRERAGTFLDSFQAICVSLGSKFVQMVHTWGVPACQYNLIIADQRGDKPVGWIPVKMTGSNSLRFPLPFGLDAYARLPTGRDILAVVKPESERRDGPDNIIDMATRI